MVRHTIHTRTGNSRANAKVVVPAFERLETRSLLSRSPAAMLVAVARPGPSAGEDHAELAHPQAASGIGTISGTVSNSQTGRPLRHVQVQLINANGFVARRALTGARGRYAFKVFTNGPYVVREVLPRRWMQTSPTFIDTAPTGKYAPGFGSKSWTYNTGNNNPANGPVGVYGWNVVAPAGNLPFESPINITVPPIDLSRYVSVNLPNTQANVVNNGHELRVQFSGSSPTMNLDGTTFTLQQLHFHDPSEDQVNGSGYPMEEHLVFKSATGALTVLAVFLQLGAPNPSLQPILNAAPASPTSSGPAPSQPAPISFSALVPSSLQGWFFQGSLTAPPLSQPVNWLVLSTPVTLSFAQLQQYEAIARTGGFLPNARPTQPLDGRQVNQFNFNVNFQNQSVTGLNFGVVRSV
jgi:carbonic anhydrase